jgi:hypothetical protein
MAARVNLRTVLIPAVILGATVAGFVIVARETASGAVSAATSPNWLLLAAAFGIGAVVQPLRALAWRQTLGGDSRFRAIYASLVSRHGAARSARRGVEGRRPPCRCG